MTCNISHNKVLGGNTVGPAARKTCRMGCRIGPLLLYWQAMHLQANDAWMYYLTSRSLDRQPADREPANTPYRHLRSRNFFWRKMLRANGRDRARSGNRGKPSAVSPYSTSSYHVHTRPAGGRGRPNSATNR